MNSHTAPAQIRLYGLVPYDRSGKARWLMTEMGVSFENKWLDRKNGDLSSVSFLKLNPMGRVPVLEYGDQAMHESGAICTFLADRHSDGKLAPETSSALRGEFLQWMYFASATLDVIQTRIMIIEDIPVGEVHTEKLAALQSDLNDALEAVDLKLVHSPYLVGGQFSAADICVAYHIFWFSLWPELDSVLKKYPRVIAYVEKLKNMPSAIESKVFEYNA